MFKRLREKAIEKRIWKYREELAFLNANIERLERLVAAAGAITISDDRKYENWVGQRARLKVKLDKATFKKAIRIFADEFNNYFTLSGGASWSEDVKYDGQVVGKKLKKQRESDWNNFVDFINSRLDDELLDKMVKDGTLREN